MKLLDKDKLKMVELFVTTDMPIIEIMETVIPNVEMTIEEFYEMLHEYSVSTGKKYTIRYTDR